MDLCTENKKISGDNDHRDERAIEVDDPQMPTLEWDDVPDLVLDDQLTHLTYLPIKEEFSDATFSFHRGDSSLDKGESYSIEDFVFWSDSQRGDFPELHPQTDGEQASQVVGLLDRANIGQHQKNYSLRILRVDILTSPEINYIVSCVYSASLIRNDYQKSIKGARQHVRLVCPGKLPGVGISRGCNAKAAEPGCTFGNGMGPDRGLAVIIGLSAIWEVDRKERRDRRVSV
ncbi:hypothetical protein B0H13DRAFT_1889803 [Mycena leptocephala]|nr:hypothetical protein B0H13DRAFT_1889803 [Mycena leptocephala]